MLKFSGVMIGLVLSLGVAGCTGRQEGAISPSPQASPQVSAQPSQRILPAPDENGLIPVGEIQKIGPVEIEVERIALIEKAIGVALRVKNTGAEPVDLRLNQPISATQASGKTIQYELNPELARGIVGGKLLPGVERSGVIGYSLPTTEEQPAAGSLASINLGIGSVAIGQESRPISFTLKLKE